MTKKKDTGNRKGYLTIRKAAKAYDIPEQTWRSWWRKIDDPELQKLFRCIPGTTRIMVSETEVDAVIEDELRRRMENAYDLAK